ncbi:helix-turn-helix domain-containing protein [Paenibacillus oenotherae]|uniref:Helix-turn-helix domain-containing protein n=1 Tax=Paenibacillus oenotherae TaxID=1435645 RepID=A0ABS7DA60_9BACL|nr:helix-turn-helix domain-containing protein [Paenibacillus oenotherae]MBW7476048.1 helix-turn-helix domain-containing protein [Paenibacillus oenotherae]
MKDNPFTLLHMQDAMDLLGVSRSTIDRWRSTKQLPYVKIGKEVLFDQNALTAWMRSHLIMAEPRSGTKASERTAAADNPSAPVTIVVGYQSGTAHMWSPLIIRELGLFEEELRSIRPFGRYRVQWLDAPSGLELVEGMIAGRVHIASLGDYPIIVSQQLSRLLPGYQSMLIAFDGKTAGGQGIEVVVPEGDCTPNLSALDASAVSTVPHSSAGCRLRKLLTATNLPGVEPIVAKGMRECLDGILKRTVSASAMWEPYISLLQYLGAGRPIETGNLEGREDYLTGVVADGEWVRNHEDAAIAYLKAHIRAHRFLRAEPFAASQLIHRATGFPAQVTGSVISRVRWDAALYGRDLDTLRRLGKHDNLLEQTNSIKVEPAYLLHAARSMHPALPRTNDFSMDWAVESL